MEDEWRRLEVESVVVVDSGTTRCRAFGCRGAILALVAIAVVILGVCFAVHIVLHPTSAVAPPPLDSIREKDCANSTENLPGGPIVPFGCNTVAGGVYRRTRSGFW